jgi:hypothetical protein
MASKKVQAALLKQKEAKQKKVLFLLVPVFLGLMAWQGPKTFKAITGGNAPPPTTAAPSTTAPTPGSAPSTPGAGAVVPPSQLVDTDAPPSLMDGQMSNLGVFPGRDPFSGGAITPNPGDVSTGGVGGGTGTGTGTTATPSSAQLEINSKAEAVSASGTFPSDDPVFKLVSLTPTSVTIALASGKNFTNGDATETIAVGETLTVNGDDGSSFVVKLVAVSSN